MAVPHVKDFQMYICVPAVLYDTESGILSYCSLLGIQIWFREASLIPSVFHNPDFLVFGTSFSTAAPSGTPQNLKIDLDQLEC